MATMEGRIMSMAVPRSRLIGLRRAGTTSGAGSALADAWVGAWGVAISLLIKSGSFFRLGMMDDRRWTMGEGRWVRDAGRWTRDDGRWTMMVYGLWSIVHRPGGSGAR